MSYDTDLIEENEDMELSLDDAEEAEEEENEGHRVQTFDADSDGEEYFDGQYFDE